MDEKKTISTELKKTLKIVGVATAIALSYAVGCKVTKSSIASGIQQAWIADPTLKDHMWDAVAKIGKQS